MTVIVGLVDKGRIWMGGDSCASNGHWQAWDITEPKIARVGPFLLGVCGSVKTSQVLRHRLASVLKHDRKKCDPIKFLCTEFADAVRQLFKDHNCLKEEDSLGTVAGRSDILIGFQSRLFTMFSDFQIYERTENFDAIGCAADCALGSMHETTKLKPKTRILRALKCAERFSVGVRSPFTILSMQS